MTVEEAIAKFKQAQFKRAVSELNQLKVPRTRESVAAYTVYAVIRADDLVLARRCRLAGD